jgi:hypothetical protein
MKSGPDFGPVGPLFRELFSKAAGFWEKLNGPPCGKREPKVRQGVKPDFANNLAGRLPAHPAAHPALQILSESGN